MDITSVSSANNNNSTSLLTSTLSLINSKGSRIVLCGTPVRIGKIVE